MFGLVREGMNPSPTLESLNPDFDYFRIKNQFWLLISEFR
jgi:hypothetical protein